MADDHKFDVVDIAAGEHSETEAAKEYLKKLQKDQAEHEAMLERLGLTPEDFLRAGEDAELLQELGGEPGVRKLEKACNDLGGVKAVAATQRHEKAVFEYGAFEKGATRLQHAVEFAQFLVVWLLLKFCCIGTGTTWTTKLRALNKARRRIENGLLALQHISGFFIGIWSISFYQWEEQRLV